MVFSTSNDSRYDACRILQQNDIPCVVWCEDALGYYGMNTTLFSLHLVVPSIDAAAEVMLQRGWTVLESRPNEVGVPWLDMPKTSMRRLLPPDWVENPVPPWPPLPPSQAVLPQPELVLHAAEYWHVPVDHLLVARDEDDFIPPLAMLADSLITAVLDSPGGTFLQMFMVRYVTVLYSQIEGTREPGFEGEAQSRQSAFSPGRAGRDDRHGVAPAQSTARDQERIEGKRMGREGSVEHYS
ncbi:hypothetical protein PG984_009913 [Apiospora sp. TS-2023a]